MANNQFPAIKRRLKPQHAQTCHTEVLNGKNLLIIDLLEAISQIFPGEYQQIHIIFFRFLEYINNHRDKHKQLTIQAIQSGNFFVKNLYGIELSDIRVKFPKEN